MSDTTTTNTTYNFYPTWIPDADDWNRMFGGKVDALNGFLTNPTVIGEMTLTQAPTAAAHVANKAYVDGKLSGSTLPDAPEDGTPYCRLNATWVPAPTTVTAVVTGDLTVPGALSVGGNANIVGNLLLGSTSAGAYKLDVGGALHAQNATIDGTLTAGTLSIGVMAVNGMTVTGPFIVTGPGTFHVNTTSTLVAVTANAAASPPAPQANTLLQLIGADGAAGRLEMDGFGNNAQLTFRTAGNTALAPAALATTIGMGNLNFVGYDGTAFSTSAASFGAITGGAWSPTSHPTLMRWLVTAVNSITLTEAMRINPSGNVSIGNAVDSGYKLDVTGSVRISGALSLASGFAPPFVLDDGTGALPASLTGAGINLTLATADAVSPVLLFASFGGTSVAPGIRGYAAGGSRAVPIASAINAPLLTLQGYGYGATGYSLARALITFYAAEAWTDTAQGTYIAFRTTPIGTGPGTGERLRIQASGNISIGLTTDAGYKLDVAGAARFDPGGGAALPALPPSGSSALTLSDADGIATQIAVVTFGNVASGAVYRGYAAAGTRAAPTALTLNAVLFSLSAHGYGATGFTASRGSIAWSASQPWTDTAQGTEFLLRVTPNGSATAAVVFRAFNSGNIMIGTAVDAGFKLDVIGVGRFWNTDATRPALIADTGNGNAINAQPTGQSSLLTTGLDAADVRSTIISYGAANSILDGVQVGGTRAVPAVTAIGRKLLALRGWGRNNAAATLAAEINFTTAEVFSATNQGTQIQFWGTPIGSAAIAEWMRLLNGNLLIGSTVDAGYKLDVNGPARINGVLTLGSGLSGPLVINSSGAAAPAPPWPTYGIQVVGGVGQAIDFLGDVIGDGASFDGRRANGTPAAPTALLANQPIALLNAFGHDGAAYSNSTAGSFQIRSLNAWSPTDHSTQHVWFGVNPGATALAAAWMTLSSGNLKIGTVVDAGYRLDVNGSSRFVNDLNANGWIINGTNTASGALMMNGQATSARQILWQTAGVARIRLALTTTAESGANAGGDLSVVTYDDTGTILANPALRLFRASANLTIGTSADAGFKLDVVGTARVSGLVTASGGITATGALQFNGPTSVGNNTTAQQLSLNGQAGVVRTLMWQTGGLSRFRLSANATAEDGSNVGSDLDLVSFNDAGTALTPNPTLRITRATGNLTLGGSVDAGFRLDVVGTGRFSGLVTASAGATVSGAALTVGSDTVTQAVQINGPAASQRVLAFRTASLTRWSVFADNAAEAGGDAGSNFTIGAYSDAGVYVGPILVGNRATRVIAFPGTLSNTTIGQDTGITAQLTLNAPAGLGKQILFRSASSSRWVMQSTATAESGSNAGSDFSIFRYDDTGVSLGSAFSITRSTGATTIPGALTLSNGGLFAGTFAGTHTYSGNITISSGSLTLGGNAVASPFLAVNGAAASQRQIQLLTAGVLRWRISANLGAEAGSNAGSDFDLTAYDDSGALLFNPAMRITRATGNLLLGSGTDAGFRLDVVGTGRFSGAVTLSAGANVSTILTMGSATATAPIWINGPAGSARIFRYQTASVSRWQIGVNSTAESGANVGSDLDINNFDDAGTIIGNPLVRITRSTGLVSAFYGLSLGSTLAPGGVSDLSRGLALWGTTFGFNVQTNRLNFVSPSGSSQVNVVNGVDIAAFSAAGARFLTDGGTVSWVAISANPQLPAPATATYLHIGGSDGSNPRLLLDAFSTFGAQLSYRNVGTGGTAAAPVAMAANQNIGVMNYFAHDGTAYSLSQANFNAVADAAWTSASHPTRFVWGTTPTGSAAAATERMRLTNAGNLLIGSTTDDTLNKLQVAGGVRIDMGLSLGSTLAPGGNTDLSRGLALFSTSYGFGVTTNRLNYVAASTAAHTFMSASTDIVSIGSTGMRVIGNAGFNNTAPIAKPTIAGACAGNTAIKALLTALASYGLVTDTTTA